MLEHGFMALSLHNSGDYIMAWCPSIKDPSVHWDSEKKAFNTTKFRQLYSISIESDSKPPGALVLLWFYSVLRLRV